MKIFKTTFYHATLIITIIISTTSCKNNLTKDTKAVANELNKAKFDHTSGEKDANFLVNAAEMNMVGINLGQLAQQKGTLYHVKELGKMMDEEHAMLMADLTELAKTKNIFLPTSQTENGIAVYIKLSKKSAKNFDKAFADMMVDEHITAIEIFEKAISNCYDPEIKAWAAATLPVLKIHLEHSLICQKECDKI